jgi:hypothetical protein
MYKYNINKDIFFYSRSNEERIKKYIDMKKTSFNIIESRQGKTYLHKIILQDNLNFNTSQSYLISNPNHTIIETTDYIYEGTVKDGIKTGYGIIEYTNGDIYEGMWENNMRNGKGIMEYFFSSNEYNGMWEDDKRSGKGIMKYIDDEEIYEGMWENDMKNGMGIMTYNNNDVYDGMWKDDMKNDMGIMTYNNKDVYDGMWKDDMKNDMGIMTYNNKDVYDGMWKDDIKNGKGMMKYNNKSIYNGMWEDDMKNGKGTMTYSDKKSIYEGMWKDDTRHGEGKMIYSDGSIYEGMWNYDKMNGMGIFTYYNFTDIYYTNARIYKGIFKNDEAVISITEPVYYNKDLSSYEIVLFITTHGCDVENDLLNQHLEPDFSEYVNPIYVGSTDYMCENEAMNSVDIMYSSLLFNDKRSTVDQIKEYQLFKRKKIQYGRPNYNHVYFLDKPKDTNGIFIIKNNIGFPNNINLFDWKNPSYINNNIMIKDLSTIITTKIEKDLDKDVLYLDALLNSFYIWKKTVEKLNNKKIDLIIVDNSCRTIC